MMVSTGGEHCRRHLLASVSPISLVAYSYTSEFHHIGVWVKGLPDHHGIDPLACAPKNWKTSLPLLRLHAHCCTHTVDVRC